MAAKEHMATTMICGMCSVSLTAGRTIDDLHNVELETL